MKIIKYIFNPKKTIIALSNKFKFKLVNDKTYLRIKYRLVMNKRLNINKPITFNEKLQWLKIYDKKDEYTTMVDKYEVKDYIANILGEEYIIPTLGVYNRFEDINFDVLPNQFVIKPTHTSGDIYICKGKKEIDYKDLRKKIKRWLKREYFYYNREWPYKNVKPRIIIEKYMKNGQEEELKDYKLYCFNGEPKFIYVSEGLQNHETARIDFFDMNYSPAPFKRTDYSRFNTMPQKPNNWEKMKRFARVLSANIIFVRVDFYEINNKLYFGELTFSPCGGYMPFEPEEYDKILGDMLKLPKKREEKNEK